MTFSKLRKTFAVVAAFALMMVGFATTAQATAIYEVEAIGLLTITDIVGGDASTYIEGDAFIFDDYTDAIGNASATNDGHTLVDGGSGPVPVGISSVIDQRAYTKGEASPIGNVFSDFLTNGEVFIDNTSSGSDVTVSFSFDYTLSADTSVSVAGEFASAIASVDVFDDFTTFLYDEIESATDLGGGLITSGGIISFDVTVPTGGFDNLVVSFVDTEGTADSPIPEPSTITLFGIPILGLLGYGWIRRRKQIS